MAMISGTVLIIVIGLVLAAMGAIGSSNHVIWAISKGDLASVAVRTCGESLAWTTSNHAPV
jgi:hypothetical protein